jgi:hypothetical protein
MTSHYDLPRIAEALAAGLLVFAANLRGPGRPGPVTLHSKRELPDMDKWGCVFNLPTSWPPVLHRDREAKRIAAVNSP